MVEAQFPVMPIGGIKLGLANIVTMAAMLFVGRKEAGLVLLLRIVLAAGLYGTVVSFAFSLTGGILAYIAQVHKEQIRCLCGLWQPRYR